MRSKELKAARDRKIVEKFHELYDLKRMRMDDVLRELSENHFFLTADYIYALIFYNKDNNEYYCRLLGNSEIDT